MRHRRSRPGFATYFQSGQGLDHLVIEYRDRDGRWVRVDPEILGGTVLDLPTVAAPSGPTPTAWSSLSSAPTPQGARASSSALDGRRDHNRVSRSRLTEPFPSKLCAVNLQCAITPGWSWDEAMVARALLCVGLSRDSCGVRSEPGERTVFRFALVSVLRGRCPWLSVRCAA